LQARELELDVRRVRRDFGSDRGNPMHASLSIETTSDGLIMRFTDNDLREVVGWVMFWGPTVRRSAGRAARGDQTGNRST
jgi:hypothetical protein